MHPSKIFEKGYIKPDCQVITVILKAPVVTSQRSSSAPESWDIDDNEFDW